MNDTTKYNCRVIH